MNRSRDPGAEQLRRSPIWKIDRAGIDPVMAPAPPPVSMLHQQPGELQLYRRGNCLRLRAPDAVQHQLVDVDLYSCRADGRRTVRRYSRRRGWSAMPEEGWGDGRRIRHQSRCREPVAHSSHVPPDFSASTVAPCPPKASFSHASANISGRQILHLCAASWTISAGRDGHPK